MKTKKVAKKIEKMGQKGDTILAHINPEEAAMLKAMGGSGERHPKTGLLQFNDNDPEGNADAGRADGTAGVESQGGFGGPGMGGGLDAFSSYGGMLGGAQPTDLSPQNPDIERMMALDQQLAPNYSQPPSIGNAPTNGITFQDVVKGIFGGLPGMVGLGIKGYQNRDWSNNTSFNLPGQTITGNGRNGNGFDGGNLPGDGATTPAVPTTPGTGAAPGLPITPPNWGNYGPSPFTYKFGAPRNNAGLLNFGS